MIFALACATPEGADTALAVPPLSPPEEVPAWAPADVAAAWDAAVAAGWPDAAATIAVYLELLSHGDDDCPGSTEQLDDSLVIGCTAASGYWYSGVATWGTGVYDGGAYERLHGDFWVETDAGLAMRVGGTAYRLRGDADVTDYFEGTWVWDGDDGPLAGGVSGAATTTVGAEGVAVDGAFGFSGIAFEADGLVVAPDGTATGTLALRDPDFGWHTAEFSGSDCATVTHDTGAAGSACFALSPLAALVSRLEAR